MNFIQEYKNQLTILASVLLIVIGYNGVNSSKIAEAQRKEKAIKLEEQQQQIRYDFCVSRAETNYWDYMKLNGTENKDGSVTAQDRFWKAGAANKEAATDLCYRQYKQ